MKAIRIKTWKELEEYGISTKEGLVIPPYIYGLKNTKVILNRDDELAYTEEIERLRQKREAGKIISVGLI
jgi:hypothetical protein